MEQQCPWQRAAAAPAAAPRKLLSWEVSWQATAGRAVVFLQRENDDGSVEMALQGVVGTIVKTGTCL